MSKNTSVLNLKVSTSLKNPVAWKFTGFARANPKSELETKQVISLTSKTALKRLAKDKHCNLVYLRINDKKMFVTFYLGIIFHVCCQSKVSVSGAPIGCIGTRKVHLTLFRNLCDFLVFRSIKKAFFRLDFHLWIFQPWVNLIKSF